jgi:O-antigen/teichoic acid export membrane protein
MRLHYCSNFSDYFRKQMSSNKSSFFRQSGWMVIATFAGGILMAAVHTVACKMGPQEYSSFVSLLRLLIILSVPASALQTVFTRQAAAVTTAGEEEQLRATTRVILGWTFLIWLLCAAFVLGAIGPISRLLSISNPAALWFTVIIVLTGLWIPVAKGLLQGKHQFGGLGWLQISDGVGRFGIMVLLIKYFGGKAASGMFAAVAGQLITIVIAAWVTRSIWRTGAVVAFAWKDWLAGAVPLTLGLGTILVMSSIDMIFVQGLFSDSGQTALYGAAMLTGFAIVQFIAPVALVMFARVARNVARAESADSLGMTLTATILFGCIAAIGCTIFPKLPLRLMYLSKPEMWAAAPLVPWFAWALLPLTVANVLVQNILARGRYQAVPWLVLVPFVYAAALCLQAHGLLQMNSFDAFTRVIQTLGCASLLLCGLAAWFCRAPVPVSVSDRDLVAAHSVSGKTSSPPA